MIVEYWQKGESLDYKNTTTATIKANTVIELTKRVGIAGNDILPGQTEGLIMEGVFKMEKSAEAYTMGQALYYNATTDKVTSASQSSDDTPVPYTPVGYAASAAASTDAKALVKLLG